MAPSLIRFAFAAASGAALASCSAQEDAAALLQTHTAVAGEASMDGGDKSKACRCLKWKEAYADYGLHCGSQEFRWVGKAKTQEGEHHNNNLKAEMCMHFYEHFDENYCVQRNFNSRAKTQWCYVSAECSELNGGGAIPKTAASWKVCNVTQDRLLQDQTPDRLYQIAQWTHMDPAYLMKMAYPVWAEPAKTKMLHWPGVQAALGILKPRNGNLTEKVQGLKEIQALDEPWILDSLDSRPPYGLVWGDKIWEVKYTPWFWTQSDNFAEVYNDKQHMVTDYTCLKGCE